MHHTLTHPRSLGAAVVSLLLITSLVFGAVPGLYSTPSAEALDVPTPTQTDNVVSTTFTLSSAATTSAGVFQKDGTLVRTLWNNKRYPSGTHKVTWNGADDLGNLLPAGSYDIKVLSSQMTYTWEGVIGNTSKAKIGPSRWKNFDPIVDMAFTSTHGYAATGYGEGGFHASKFAITDPQTVLHEYPNGGRNVRTYLHAATDGNIIYYVVRSIGIWGQTDGKYVIGHHTSNDAFVSFPNGVAHDGYGSVVGLREGAGAEIFGLAVQKNGPFLFISRKDLNEVLVVNKTTGATVRANTLTAPTKLAADGAGNLWVTFPNTKSVVKYKVATDGSLTPLATLSGFQNPLAVAVSPDNTTTLVADGGSSQQVKAFSNQTPSNTPVWILGEGNGYANNPTVTNNKVTAHLTSMLATH